MLTQWKRGRKMAKEKKRKKSRIKSLALRRFLLALKVSLLVILLVVLVGGIIFYFTYGKELLKMQKEAKTTVAASTLDTFRSSETSVIYDSKGKKISELKGEKDVYYLEGDEIPDYVKTAFLSIEDKKFYEHGGVDYLAILRAVIARIKNGRVTQGGSTITQQLVKNVFLTQERTMDRKLREMFYSMEMEKKYTKDQILEFYINNVYFGHGYYGIQAASYGYFKKDASKLSLSEVAFLCAIPNGPTRYDPLTHYDNTIKRRNLILKNMLDDSKIMLEEYEYAVAENIKLKEQKTSKQDYVETFARHSATRALMEAQGFQFRYSFSSDSDKKRYQEEYNELYEQCEQSLYTGGYRIYTSISMAKQKKLQKVVNDELQGFTEKNSNGVYKMQGAAVCISNKTGRVVAIVGGRKQQTTNGYTLNRAFQSYRQPGSSIKPLIVYTPSFENGYTPESIVDDSYFNGGPRNSNGSYAGKISVRSAVAASKNVIAWKLFQELTPKVGLSYILKMGFSNIVANDYYAASSLGGLTNGVSPLEMASGFATIENDGYYREPSCITKITDSRDNTIYKGKSKGKQVYSKESTSMMTSCMESVIEEGTARGLGLSKTPTAGKTGTTNDKKDGWFCGYSAYYTTAVWVGYDTPRTVNDLYGNTYPGRIWHNFMEDIHASVEYQTLHDEYNGKKSKDDSKDRVYDEPEDTVAPEDATEEPTDTEEPEDTEAPVTKEPDNWDDGKKEPVVTEKPKDPETEPPKQQEEEVVDPGGDVGDVGMEETRLWRPRRV